MTPSIAMNGTTTLYLVELRRLSHLSALGDETEGAVWGEVKRRVAELIDADFTLERTGSDQFVVALSGHDAEEARRTAARLRSALREEFRIPSGGVRCQVAVGVVVSGDAPERAVADDTAVARARRALLGARASTDGVFVVDRTQ